LVFNDDVVAAGEGETRKWRKSQKQKSLSANPGKQTAKISPTTRVRLFFAQLIQNKDSTQNQRDHFAGICRPPP
jgi:hypothetical protein